MKWYYGLCLVICCLMVWTQCRKDSENPAEPEKTGFVVHKINYNGWKEAIEIKNNSTQVVVVPAIGRIMFYGFKDGPNLLWNDPTFYGRTLPPNQPYTVNGRVQWANFGGDKVWPTEQADFPKINDRSWPPDHWFDGQAHTYEILENGVRITSPVSDYCGARGIREIKLGLEGSRLTIEQIIEKVKPARKSSVEPISYTIWNVTQIVSPVVALFNLNPNSKFLNKYYSFPNNPPKNFVVEDQVGLFVPDPVQSQKAGADSDEWLAAIIGNTVISEFFSLEPEREYPDGGLSAEVYTCSEYTELELLSPLKQLSVGQSLTHTIHWDLYALPATAKTLNEKINAATTWLNDWWD